MDTESNIVNVRLGWGDNYPPLQSDSHFYCLTLICRMKRIRIKEVIIF